MRLTKSTHGWHGALALTLSITSGSLSTAQTTVPANSHAAEIQNEASDVFGSLQQTIASLPNAERTAIMSEIKRESVARPEKNSLLPSVAQDPTQLLRITSSALTLEQRSEGIHAMADALNVNTQERVNSNTLIQRAAPSVQQVVDPSILAKPANQQALAKAAEILSALVPAHILSPAALAPLAQKYRSIGRLLWTTRVLAASATPMWQLSGTVFVTRQNVVTTACHTLMGDTPLLDISGTSVKLRPDVVLKVEFGDSTQLQQMYDVTGIAAISGLAGCDVAQLTIEGADSIPALKVAHDITNAQQILVVGYPKLSDYKFAENCDPTLGDTYNQFCNFYKDNADVAKVVSPGKVFKYDTHDGVSVITYNAPTDTGQSGSPVFDAATLDVIGVHYCCTGTGASISPLVCATWHPENVGWNEAIASSTVVQDTQLKTNFSDVDFDKPLASVPPNSQMFDASVSRSLNPGRFIP